MSTKNVRRRNPIVSVSMRPFSLASVALLIAYPALVHLAVATSSPIPAAGALVALVASALWQRLAHGQPGVWLVLMAGFVVSAGLVWLGGVAWVFYSAPVVSPLALLTAFAASLRPGETPMITRLAGAARRQPLPAPARVYTRRVTQLWVAAFAALALGNALLAAFAPITMWSRFVNGIDYIAVGALFVAEWLFRQFYRRRRMAAMTGEPSEAAAEDADPHG